MRKLRLIETEEAQAMTEPAMTKNEVKVALATNDLKRVDAHFNGARNFAIYAVSASGHRFLEAVQFDSGEGDKLSEKDARIMTKIHALEGCAMLFVKAIGGPAAAKVVKNRIHPLKAKEDEPIDDVLDRIKDVLQGTPPPWLRKTLRQDEARDFSFLDEDDDA